MIPKLSFSQLTDDEIGQVVEIRGKIVEIFEGFFLKDEVSLSQCHAASLTCKYTEPVNDQQFVALVGKLCCQKETHSHRISIFFEVDSIGYIIVIDANSSIPMPSQSYFTIENLSQLQMPKAEQMFKILNAHALMEGFKLTHKRSLKEKYIVFRCERHSIVKSKA